MSYQLDSSNRSVLLYVKTRQLGPSNFLSNDVNTNLRIQLDNPISCNSGETMILSLYSLSMPNTFYNVDSRQNSFTLNGITYSITPGNYNSRTLLQAIDARIESITGVGTISITYNSITSKVIITYSGAQTLVLTTIAKSIGFNTNTTIPVGTTTSPYILNIYDDLSVYLRTNINLGSARDHTGQFFDALERVPLNGANSVSYYISPAQSHKNIILDKDVSTFTVSLTWDNANEYVQLNGADWEFCLLFQTIKTLDRAVPVDLRREIELINTVVRQIAQEAPQEQSNTTEVAQ
jgi:hypothetical protein